MQSDLDVAANGWNRREFLARTGAGFGTLGLGSVLQGAGLLAGTTPPAGPMSPRPSHFPAKARAVIWLFMHGAPSTIDLFDPKPELDRRHGTAMNLGTNVGFFASSGTVMKSPFRFARHGQSGAWMSEVLPNIARHVDDFAFLRSLHVESNNHGPALYEMNSGLTRIGFPSVGSWVTYGLGSENQNLPGYMVMVDYRAAPEGGPNSWGCGFLPGVYQGTPVRSTGSSPILHLNPLPQVGPDRQRRQLDFAEELNRRHLERNPGEAELLGRIQNFELAYRMQTQAPEAFDLARETAATHRLYGLDNPRSRYFGSQMLLTRRLIERGVRFVQVYSGGTTDTERWDAHTNVKKNHEDRAAETDVPVAGLLTDLKQRGLLESTLVIWGGEFGRLPITQGSDVTGRDHNRLGFGMWLTGAGIKGGASYGATDELGLRAVENPLTVHDVHATILHLLGMDHTRLTYQHNGRQYRLTDVAGNVIHPILS